MCVWVGAWGRVRFFVYTLDFVSMCVYMNVHMHNVAVYHFIVCIWVCVYVREHARERKAERANERTSRRPGSIVGESYVTWGPAATHSDIRTIYNRVIKPRVTAAALGRTACPPAVTHTATPAHPSWQPAGPGANRILPRTLGTNVVLGDRKNGSTRTVVGRCADAGIMSRRRCLYRKKGSDGCVRVCVCLAVCLRGKSR